MYNPMTNPYNYPYQDQYNRPSVQAGVTPLPTQYAPQNDASMIWVQGEAGAKAFPVQNGRSVVLFDSETERFFIKTTDISGMPQPLRVYKYTEATKEEKPADTSNFITREEFDEAIKDLKQNIFRKESKTNGKPAV